MGPAGVATHAVARTGFHTDRGTQNHISEFTITSSADGAVRTNNILMARDTCELADRTIFCGASLRIQWYDMMRSLQALNTRVSVYCTPSTVTGTGLTPDTGSHTQGESVGGASNLTSAVMMSLAIEPLPLDSACADGVAKEMATLAVDIAQRKQTVRRRFIAKPLDFIDVAKNGGSMTKLTTNVQSPPCVGECVRR